MQDLRQKTSIRYVSPEDAFMHAVAAVGGKPISQQEFLSLELRAMVMAQRLTIVGYDPLMDFPSFRDQYELVRDQLSVTARASHQHHAAISELFEDVQVRDSASSHSGWRVYSNPDGERLFSITFDTTRSSPIENVPYRSWKLVRRYDTDATEWSRIAHELHELRQAYLTFPLPTN